MLSARVQQGPRLVGIVWLEHDSQLARLVGSVARTRLSIGDTSGICGSSNPEDC